VTLSNRGRQGMRMAPLALPALAATGMLEVGVWHASPAATKMSGGPFCLVLPIRRVLS